jgi:hypothetical protein
MLQIKLRKKKRLTLRIPLWGILVQGIIREDMVASGVWQVVKFNF